MFSKQIGPIIVLLVQFIIIITTQHISCPKNVTRRRWNAVPPKSTTYREGAKPYVVIHHSETPECSTETQCTARVKSIQLYHMNSRGWSDIGYNFLIGGNGYVYEGRGWDVQGAHAPTYNSKSIGICMIGSFKSSIPNLKQFNSLKKLLECGVAYGKLDTNYHLIGHRQARDTDCPGDSLFNKISTWEHFQKNP